MTGTSNLHELSENKTSGSSTNQEDLGTEWHLKLVHSVNGARGGFEEGSLFIGKVLDLVALCKVAIIVRIGSSIDRDGEEKGDLLLDVVGETTVSGDTGQ